MQEDGKTMRAKQHQPSLAINTAAIATAAAAIMICFSVAGCSSAAQPAAKPAATVTSSIADGAKLSAPVEWQASVKPAKGQIVQSVDFSVDGKTEWTEHNAPYFFNDDKDLFYPWLLGGGTHVLGLKVTLASGSTVVSTAHVTTTARVVPADLLGTWTHTVLPSDLSGPKDQTPDGIWSIKIGANGLISMADFNGQPQVEAFTATSSTLTMAGTVNWLVPDDNQGGFCEPEGLAAYTWTRTGGELTLTSSTDKCTPRHEVFHGTWTRQNG
jgi:hypothetical protein